MNKAQSVGLALIVLGIVFFTVSFGAQPRRTGALIAGVLFVVAGIVRILRSRREP